ncbi:MAG TPA: hypothetical protein VF519_05730 [Mycobacteriales bacterium]
MRRLSLALVAAAALLSTAPAANAVCIPSWTGYGPVVTVKPDLAHPLNSSVDYNSSAFSIEFDLCVI